MFPSVIKDGTKDFGSWTVYHDSYINVLLTICDFVPNMSGSTRPRVQVHLGWGVWEGEGHYPSSLRVRREMNIGRNLDRRYWVCAEVGKGTVEGDRPTKGLVSLDLNLQLMGLKETRYREGHSSRVSWDIKRTGQVM